MIAQPVTQTTAGANIQTVIWQSPPIFVEVLSGMASEHISLWPHSYGLEAHLFVWQRKKFLQKDKNAKAETKV